MTPTPTAALVLFGLLTGAVVLLIFKATSSPDRVLLARNRALSRVLELWLTRGDPWVGFRSLGSMVGDSFRYLATLLVPLVCSLLPMLLLLWLAHERFAFRPLRPGETVLLVARLVPDAPAGALDAVAVAPPPGLETSLPPVRTPAWREIAWPLTAPAGADPRPLRAHLRAHKPPRVASLDLRLPAAEYTLLGWRTDWFRGLLAVSLAAGLALKRPLRVEF